MYTCKIMGYKTVEFVAKFDFYEYGFGNQHKCMKDMHINYKLNL